MQEKRKKYFLIISALIISILLAGSLSVLIKPKEKPIPVLPFSLVLELSQADDFSLQLKSASLQPGYAPDYQSLISGDFYLIRILKGSRILFEGRIAKRNFVVQEDLAEVEKTVYQKEMLGEFSLPLPFFEKADWIVFLNEQKEEILRVDLASLDLEKPAVSACGDGICSDDEGFLKCFSDCRIW